MASPRFARSDTVGTVAGLDVMDAGKGWILVDGVMKASEPGGAGPAAVER